MAYVCDAIKNFMEPPESEISESANQPPNFVELSDYELYSLKGSIQSKSSDKEEKSEKKNIKKVKAVDSSIAKKE